VIDEGKGFRRSALPGARAAVSDEVRRAESEQLCSHLPGLLRDVRVVAAYVPVGTEPGSAEILDALAGLCQTVLLPVVCTGADGEHLPLRWGRYQPGTLKSGRFGLREPAEPWLPATALAEAQVVLVPALAVDRRGVRLGRGGGFYDRSLPRCGKDTLLVAVVRDSEVVDELPHEPHDVRMTHALTPGAGLIRLGECEGGDGGSST
jgi:5-formyltetrahydrofolate cyclo-ligase